MTKKIFAVMLAIVFCLSLAACAAPAETAEPAGTDTETAPPRALSKLLVSPST